MTTPADDASRCAICRRGEAPVCERCRTRTAEQLAALPALADRLRTALVPGSTGIDERVTAPRGEAPMPARLAALSLLAKGSDDARCTFVPAVRVWTTTEPGPDDDSPPKLTWHRETMYDDAGRLVMTLTDDQTGVLPLGAWLRAWSLAWRRILGHSTLVSAVALKDRRSVAARLDPDADAVETEWARRWPADTAGWGPTTSRHFGYLTTWLPTACEQMTDIGDFAASLRTLTGAVRAALGDHDDLEYLGRCPEEITDPSTGQSSVCGADFWHDPYASVITCPRCHTETSQDHRIWLARRILDAWPIDPRRRYPRGLIDVLRRPTCATCAKPLRVEWLDATERADLERFWRPGTIACPAGCETYA